MSTDKEPSWKKHTTFDSDEFVENVLSPDGCAFSGHVKQLAKDFKTLKNRFINLWVWEEAGREWDALPEEEKEKQRQRAKVAEEELRKVWDQGEDQDAN